MRWRLGYDLGRRPPVLHRQAQVDPAAVDFGRDDRISVLDTDARPVADRNVADVRNVEWFNGAGRIDDLPGLRRCLLARCLGHEIAPDARGQTSARDALQRAIVVVADPHADNEPVGIADEQRVAIVLAGAGLAEIRLRQRST